MLSPVVVTDDVQTERGEVVTEQLKAEVITDSVIEQVKVLHDEEHLTQDFCMRGLGRH